MSREWRYLEVGDFLLIAEAVTGILANVLAESDRIVSQADSAPHVPQSGFGATEVYPGFGDKAAILCARLIQNHPLPDGNKRTAFLCMIEFIERNGFRLETRPDDSPRSIA